MILASTKARKKVFYHETALTEHHTFLTIPITMKEKWTLFKFWRTAAKDIGLNAFFYRMHSGG